MQSLNSIATLVQNPSVSKLIVVKMKHNSRSLATEDRGQGMHKSCYCCGRKMSHPKRECLTRNAECFKCWKRGQF